ncbi:FAD-dependent glycerol-3-phosphate dehydrogenase, putative [Plasmodium reichenowi]|uniref:Glycerol-3-phosphate dehydrogenase n=1 Tax=Plasmodium reichenowi TaxID=5854 RepID=A0A151LTR7_PLARE|nr:FAD-dependent glycerol-3-phosphate dehydrogenase, putative [Plasmodium reichenowi]KYO02558.1 FAD-dependent glycerol-3-phosphate dehydrogenase, putative [Plasmodium reichenowi]
MIKKVAICSGTLGILSYGGFYFLKINFQKNMIDKDVTYKYRPCIKRNEMIKKLQENQYDLLIIGGGATGAGLALDAATRGLKCALVEKNDFSSGTSSKSTKLLHGGIRYLENAVNNLDFTELYFVWEALAERAHTMKIAPYLSRPVSILMPIYKYWQVPYFSYNIKIYDLLADLVCYFDKGVPNSLYIRKSNTIDNFPLLRKDKLKGSLIYFDGQHDDSRMNLNLILTSAIDDYVPGQIGATVCNHMEVKNFIKDENNKLVGVRAIDKINDKEIEIFSKVIINATGPYGDIIRKLADENRKPMIQVSVGCHFILPKWYSTKNNGMIIPKTSDDRVLFLLPWENNTLVGTTDEKRIMQDDPKIQEKDIEFLTNELSKYIHVSAEEIKNDITAAWCGFRPLISKNNNKKSKFSSNKKKNNNNNINSSSSSNNNNFDDEQNNNNNNNIGTHEISRSHEIIEDDNGLISILGGKWTIYRKMAQDTLDYILCKYPNELKTKYNCRTKFLKLIGCHDKYGIFNEDDLTFGCSKLSKTLVNKYPQIDFQTANHLVSNYGYLSENVCELAKELNMFNKIDSTKPYIEAEIIYATRYEFANTISDIIGRRFRLGFIDSQVSNKVIDKIAQLLKNELTWNTEQLNKNVKEAKDYINSLSLKDTP